MGGATLGAGAPRFTATPGGGCWQLQGYETWSVVALFLLLKEISRFQSGFIAGFSVYFSSNRVKYFYNEERNQTFLFSTFNCRKKKSVYRSWQLYVKKKGAWEGGET